jgi:hypothetical protein
MDSHSFFAQVPDDRGQPNATDSAGPDAPAVTIYISNILSETVNWQFFEFFGRSTFLQIATPSQS